MEVLVLRYISLWKSFFYNSLSRDLEFKANFLGGLIVDIVYYSIQFFFFSVIYSYVDAIGVFKREDVIIFLVITFLADTFYMFFFSGNLFNLNNWMVKGDLDFFLLKPIESQFMVSFRYVKSYAILSLIILIIMLSNLLFAYPNGIAFLNIVSFIFSFIMGIGIWYSIDFLISSSCFWFKNFSVAGWLSHEIIKFSSRPDTIYTGLLRKLLFSIVPMTLVASIPARNLLYGPNILYLSWQFFVLIVFLLLSRIIWKRGVLRYESASS
jgi:ABC-2 type transport system permease protein